MVGSVLHKTSSSLYYEVYDKLMNPISTKVVGNMIVRVSVVLKRTVVDND